MSSVEKCSCEQSLELIETNKKMVTRIKNVITLVEDDLWDMEDVLPALKFWVKQTEELNEHK